MECTSVQLQDLNSICNLLQALIWLESKDLLRDKATSLTEIEQEHKSCSLGTLADLPQVAKKINSLLKDILYLSMKLN